jgi:DNA primase
MDRSTDLVEVLTDLGVEVHRVQNDEINGRCPVHHLNKGRESSRFSWYINSETGLWYCFSCGGRGNLSMLVSELTTDPSAMWSVQKHLIDSGLRRLSEPEHEAIERHSPVDWLHYTKFDQYPDRLCQLRRIEPEIARKYGIRWDKENKATILPILSPSAELWGWQAKKKGWVRNYPEGIHKGDTLFGIERAFAPVAVVLESPLDVVRFHSVYAGSEYSAVATFGANISDNQVNLLVNRFDGILVALDNDSAGKTETKRLAKRLPSMRSGIRYWKYTDMNDVKDLGDMTDGQIMNGLNGASVIRV